MIPKGLIGSLFQRSATAAEQGIGSPLQVAKVSSVKLGHPQFQAPCNGQQNRDQPPQPPLGTVLFPPLIRRDEATAPGRETRMSSERRRAMEGPSARTVGAVAEVKGLDEGERISGGWPFFW